MYSMARLKTARGEYLGERRKPIGPNQLERKKHGRKSHEKRRRSQLSKVAPVRATFSNGEETSRMSGER